MSYDNRLPDEDRNGRYRHLERVAFFLDRAVRIPGTNIRFGFDPVIGLLLPGGGDALSAFISAYIIIGAVKHGVPKIAIARMALNVLIDLGAGSLPLIGDLFDFAWKANHRNINLLKKYASRERRADWGDWLWVSLVVGTLGLAALLLIGLVVYAVKMTGFTVL